MGLNRRGLIFSLVSIFMFFSLILAGASISLRINDEIRLVNQEIPSRIDRTTYNTISNDIARLFRTRVNNSVNITINEVMPHNISGSVNDYEQFLMNVYSNQTISNFTFTSREEALYLSNHSKITYGPNKTWFNLTSNETIDYYNLRINSTSNAVTVSSDWPWTSSGVYVNLTIRDDDGSINTINGSTSGYINPGFNNQFNITYNGSVLSIRLNNNLFLNTTELINTSTTIGLEGNVYTGHVLRINNKVLELIKEYKTIIK